MSILRAVATVRYVFGPTLVVKRSTSSYYERSTCPDGFVRPSSCFCVYGFA